MPKFISSSGQVYSHDKLPKDEDEILATVTATQKDGSTSTPSDIKKPSAINKKGFKEKQKSSLDLFKEELKRLNEERDEQRNKFKNSLDNSISQTTSSSSSISSNQTHQKSQHLIPVPLKPDPRCPTSLTLQVNLDPKDRSSGSFDTGDPSTTNLYLGNLNPTVTENDLCDIFGRFGPLASIKVMWPRTDEERARNRNSGFVAYMSRIDAERALKMLNGMEFRGYEIKLGWGKSVPIPKNPVFIPEELVKMMQPPPLSGLPFNAQLHENDADRQYKVEKATVNDKEFMQVFQRSTVKVFVPQDQVLLERIHKTVEYVIREGPVFEAIIMAREGQNPDYKFLYDYQSNEHVYFRWKLYSILHGDSPYEWSTSEFKMYRDGPNWKPPAMNPFADGMPLDLVAKLTGIEKEVLADKGSVVHAKKVKTFNETTKTIDQRNTRVVGKLGTVRSKEFQDIISNLEPTKKSIGAGMLFCINHADAASEIIHRIKNAICSNNTIYKNKIALLFLISDILHNSSAPVPNASSYRTGFQDDLSDILENLSKYLTSQIDDPHRLARFKEKILAVLRALKYSQLYDDDFIIQLTSVFLKYTEPNKDEHSSVGERQIETSCSLGTTGHIENVVSDIMNLDESIDGEPIDDELLASCLESKGLSLRWYKTLDLSDDEDENSPQTSPVNKSTNTRPEDNNAERTKLDERVKFKASKWEIVTEESGDHQQKSPLISTSITITPVVDMTHQTRALSDEFLAKKTSCTNVKQATKSCDLTDDDVGEI